jgi:hypothetical protein
MDPSTGEQLQRLLNEVMDQPREVLDRVKGVLAD